MKCGSHFLFLVLLLGSGAWSGHLCAPDYAPRPVQWDRRLRRRHLYFLRLQALQVKHWMGRPWFGWASFKEAHSIHCDELKGAHVTTNSGSRDPAVQGCFLYESGPEGMPVQSTQPGRTVDGFWDASKRSYSGQGSGNAPLPTVSPSVKRKPDLPTTSDRKMPRYEGDPRVETCTGDETHVRRATSSRIVVAYELVRPWLGLLTLCILVGLSDQTSLPDEEPQDVPTSAVQSGVETGTSPHRGSAAHNILSHVGVSGVQGLAMLGLGLIILTYLTNAACMMHFNSGSSVRNPPLWGPEMQEHYAFRAWTHDVLVWSVACDADPARKAAMLAMSLRGTAYEYVRTLPPMVLIQGGQINGHAVDPLTFLMHSLAERFGTLGEEMRLTSITDLFHFKRNVAANERIDEVITRFDMLRQRAFDMGQLTISVTGLTWLLLRACEVSDTQLLQLLGPFQGRFPQDEAEFSALKVQLRRMGHILERSPGNIAASLRGPGGLHPNSTRTYLAEAGAGTQPPQPSAESWGEGWSQSAVPTWHASDSYSQPHAEPVWYAEDSDNGTDTDTASSSGETVVPQATPEGDTDPSSLTEYLFWAYTRAKAAWRKHLNKPTRAVRRHTRRYIYSRSKGLKGFKGKGYKGRPNVSTFLAELGDDEVEYVFKGMRKGKGKGKAHRSTGKGKGRKSNPKGRDGQTLRCFRCGSEAHLSRECHLPRTDAHASRTQPQPPNTFYAYTPSSAVPDEGPLSGLIFMASPAEDGMPGATETDSSWSYPSQPSANVAPDPWATYLRQQGAFRNPACGSTPPSAEPRYAQQPFVHAAATSSADRPAGGPCEGVPYAFLGHDTRMTRMIVETPAPTLPAWVQLPEFGYVNSGTVHRTPEHTPLLATSVSSNLEGPMATLIDNFVNAGQAVTQRWLGEESASSTTPAAAVQSSLDAPHQPTFNVFSQAQQTMQVRRREARRRQRRIIQLPEAADTQQYEAVDDTCPLCREVYLERDSVVRL